MKKQTEKKNTKWIILAILVLLVAIGVALFLTVFSGNGSETETTTAPTQDQTAHPVGLDGKLYWNVDGATYRGNTLMIRPQDSGDGYIYMQFAVGGEQVRLPVADRTLANKIDMLKVMGLVFNEEGVVVDAKRIEEFTGGYAANEYYVTSVEGNVIHYNSAAGLDGFSGKFVLEEDTKIWNVGGEGLMVGLPGSITVEAQVIAIKNAEGKITEVFVMPYEVPGTVYFSDQRLYDATTKRTKRERDESGNFVFRVAVEGEEKLLKVRDIEIASQMDSQAARCFGLDIDEEGNITAVYHAGTYTGGGVFGSWYHVTGVEGREVSVRRVSGSGAGNTGVGVMTRDCEIYDVSGMGEWFGQPTELRVGDQIHALKDSRGQICYVFIVNRAVDSEIYWNVERKWDSKTSLTTRTPDYDGWYRIKVAVRGKQMTVKTQDPDIVQKIDARAAKCFGLKLNGDVIEKFYTPEAVTIGGTWASWYDVTALDGNLITVVKASTGDEKFGTIAPDCEIYNVASNAKLVGQVDQVRVGDRVHTLVDLNGEVSVIYIVNRYEDLPIYWNYTRKYDSKTKQTTRKPDANGYYVFEMAHNGGTVSVKTRDKEVANAIDSQAAKTLAMEVHNGIVYRAMHPSNSTSTKGGATSSWTYVTSVSNYGFNTKKVESGQITKTYNETFAPNVKIYNVSTNYTGVRGEKTSLQVGDFVHCLKNNDKQVVYVFVMERFEDLGVYYNLERKYDSTAKQTTRKPDANGVYSFQMAHDGKEITVKTKSKAVANAIDEQVAKVLGIQFDSQGYAIKAIHAKGTVECKGGIGVSYATVTAINGNQVTTSKDGELTTWTLASNANVFDVSSKYKVNRGERTTLREGDFVHCLKDSDGKTNYVYCMTRVVVLPVGQHTCEHVKDNVKWFAWDGTQCPGQSGYYYLTQDVEDYSAGRISVGADVEMTICLNGHTLKSKDRMFNIYGKLTICDHKVDGEYKGMISSSLSCPVDPETGKTTATYGGMFYMYNSGGNNPVLNLYGGTLEHTGKVSTGGIGYLGNSSAADAGVCTMNIYDGTVRGGATYGNGAGLHISNGSVLNMTGGTITGAVASGNGGGVNIETGVFNMSGGKLTGNKGGEGGNLRVGSKGVANISGDAVIEQGSGGNITCLGTLNISGGTVGNCVGTGVGNNILTFANLETVNSRLTISGGTIDGNIRMGSNNGTTSLTVTGGTFTGDINVQDGNNTLILGGELNLPLVNLNAGQAFAIHEDGLADTSRITVAVGDESFAFTVITDANDEGCFLPVDDEVYHVVNKENSLYMESKIIHEHCTCGGNVTNLGAHTTCDNARWTPWVDDSSLPTSGRIVLTKDVTLSNYVTVAKNTTLEICLNGHTVTSGANSRVFRVFGELSITDCQKNADGSFKGSVVSAYDNSSATDGKVYGGVIYAYNEKGQNPVINIYGGNLVSTGKVHNGGIAYLGNKSDDEAGVATMNIYAGTLSGGYANSTGGNINVTNLSVLNVYGGTISGGSATSGGNIYNASKCTVNLFGGTVENGTARTNGGGNVHSYAALKITGTQILGGSAKGSGGSVNIDGGTVTFTSGKISGGQTESEGGNIRVGGSAELIVEGNAVIENGKAKTNGGNMAIFGKLTMTGGTLRNGTGGSGSNISAFANAASANAQISIDGAVIEDGAIRVGAKDGTASLAISNATIADRVLIESAKVTFTVEGKVELSQVKLNAGTEILVGELDDSSVIYVEMAEPGEFATITDANDEACFESFNSSYTVSNEDGVLSLITSTVTPPVVDTHTHCVCGGNAKDMTDHTCADITYTKWTETGSLPTSGSYYLDTDVKLTGTITVAAGDELNLCLNGHSIESTVRVFSIKGTLNLTDCDETAGVITGNTGKTQANGGVFYIYNNGEFNLFGGELTAGKVTGEGGVGCVAGGVGSVMNMYGGTIRDGEATKTGGNIVIWDGATFNMYGGKISGGSGTGGGNINIFKGIMKLYDGTVENGVSSGYGGNIRTGETGELYIYGGLITGGQAVSGGGNVYGNQIANKSQYAQIHISGGTITKGKLTGTDQTKGAGLLNYAYTYLSGNPVISGNEGSNISSSTRVPTVEGEGLTEGAAIYVDLETNLANAVMNASKESDADYVYCTDPGYDVFYKDGKLYLKETVAHKHCICNDTDPEHTHEPSLAWEEWTSETALPTDSGNYVLTKDVILSKAHRVEKNVVQSICLNGHSVTGCGTARVFSIYGTLNVTDCQKDADGNYKGSVQSSFSGSGKYGGIFYIYNKDATAPIFNLYGGKLVSTATEAIQGGGIGYIGNGANTDGTKTEGQFNMYDGVLTGGKAGTSSGGALVVGNYCSVNIYGGTVTGNTVTGTVNTDSKHYVAGGAVIVNGNGSMNIHGGAITANTAVGHGGNIAAYGGILNIYGGEISNGESTSNSAGNIYLTGSSKLTMTGGTVSGGYGAKGKSGGSINIAVGTHSITGGLITGGGRAERDTEAGNICIANGATLTLGGNAIVEKGMASNGGNIGLFGTLNLEGNAIIRDADATASGGNIAAYSGMLNIYGGEISNGESTSNSAGNIYLTGSSKLTMTGGTVSGGHGAKGKSGGSINIDAGTHSITGGLITGGGRAERDTEAGNIRIANGATLTLGGNAIVEKGMASNGGNIGLFGTLNLEGNAIIRDADATASGGNISMFANLSTAHATLNMTGGTITGGKAKTAAAIRAEGNDGTVVVNITGGKVECGEASDAYDCILLGKPKAGSATGEITMTLGGTAKIAEIFTKGADQIFISTEKPFTEATTIKIGYGSNSTTFLEGVVVNAVPNADVAGYFESITDKCELIYDEAAKTLSFKALS